MAPLEYIEYGVYGDLIIISPQPYSIYLRGTTGRCGFDGYGGWTTVWEVEGLQFRNLGVPGLMFRRAWDLLGQPPL